VRARKLLTPDEFKEWDARRWVVDASGKPAPDWAAKLKGAQPVRTKFSKDSIKELKAKVNENPKLNSLFAMVDTINLALLCQGGLDRKAVRSGTSTSTGGSVSECPW
jgi:hypothetical protein